MKKQIRPHEELDWVYWYSEQSKMIQLKEIKPMLLIEDFLVVT